MRRAFGSLQAINQRREVRRKKEAESMVAEISAFEKNLNRLVAPSSSKQDDERFASFSVTDEKANFKRNFYCKFDLRVCHFHKAWCNA